MPSKKNFKLQVREKVQSQRQLKASRAIQVVLVDCLRKNARLDYRLQTDSVNITKVNMSADLRIVNCFFSLFNSSFTPEEILDAFEKSRFVIREYVTRNISSKFSPEIRFYYDTAFENMQLIDTLLQR